MTEKTLFFLIISLTLFSSCHVYNIRDINQNNNSNNKTGYWVEQKGKALLITKYKNNKKHGKALGIHYAVDKDSIKSIYQMRYKNGNLTGKYKRFSSKGEVINSFRIRKRKSIIPGLLF